MNVDRIVLEIESQEYECSKNELSKFSEYFEIMFTRDFAEKSKTRIKLKSVTCTSWEHIQGYIKDGCFNAGKSLDEMLDLLETANMLRFTDIEDRCSEVISSFVKPVNCLKVLDVGSRLESEMLIRKARAFALWHFDRVVESDDFYGLSVDQVEGYCSDPALHCSAGEWGVWKAIENWMRFPSGDSPSRTGHVSRLLLCLRLNSLSLGDLERMSSCDSVRESPWVAKVIGRIIEERSGFASPKDESDCKKPKRQEDRKDSEQIDLLIENWLMVEPRKVPSVACVVGNLTNGSDPGIPYIMKFCEGEKKFVPLTRLEMMERSEGTMLGFKVISDGFKIYLVGGSSMTRQNSWNDAVWTYDWMKNKWSRFSSTSRPIRHMSVCLLENEIYIMGGFGRHRVIQNQVSKVCLESGVWSECALLPQNLYSIPCVAFRNSIYLFDCNLYEYNPKKNVWFKVESVKSFERGFSCAVADEEFIYLAGKCTNVIYKFDPGNRRDDELDMVGRFKHECNQACLIDGFIYSLSQDDEAEEVFCEKMNVRTGETIVLYEGRTDSAMADLSPRHHHGCFPFHPY